MLEIRMKAITSRQNPTVRVFRELADAPDPVVRQFVRGELEGPLEA